jgi:hypothetical protein
MTKGSFTIPLVVAGGFCLLGAFSYLVIVGRIEPLTFERERANVPAGARSSI